MKAALSRPLFAWTLLLAAGLYASPSFVNAQEPEKGEGEHAGEHDENGEHSELETAMEGLKKGMRALRRGVDKPDKSAEMIEIVQAMQQASLAAFPLCPEPLEEVDAAGLAKWQTGFKKGQLALCGTLVNLELALAEGRLEDAKELYGRLNDIKGNGHDKYDPE